MQTHAVSSSFSSSDSWSILSEIERSIKEKIEAVGTPLKDWDIQINYGIKTGFNDAFIIDSVKRNEILSACQTEEERQQTAEIIRPILRGRDIKRYSYVFAEQYLIATFPAKQYDIDDYPALKDYLLAIGIERLEQTGEEHIINGERVKARKRTNNKWFETQDSISYWDEFSKPKIVWAELSRTGNSFAYSDDGAMVLNTCYILSFNDNEFHEKELNTLLGFLNSKVALFYLDIISSKLDETGWRWLKQFVELIPVPVQLIFKEDGQLTNKDSASINAQLYEQLGLSPDEAEYLDHII